MAIIAPLFFLLMFGILDFGRLFFTQLTLQHAMREAGRFGVTGRKLDDPQNPSSQLSRVASIKYKVQQVSAGLAINPQQIRILPVGSASDAPDSAGGPGQTFTISLTYNLQLITPMIGSFFGPDGIYTFTVRTTFRNEPFDPSQST
jgi:Flp pilus assembly protein TadG